MEKIRVTKQEMKRKTYITTLANNQVVINDTRNNVIDFISYDTLIARYNLNTNKLTLNMNWWDYSKTTRTYFKEFINSYCNGYHYEDKKTFVNDYKIGGIY